MLVAMMCAAFTGAWAETKTDVLNQPWTGASGTNYSAWSDKTATSDAVYAGNSAGGNSSIQLRSNNNNSGIVTTTSGGKVKSITIVWNSSTQNGRTLNVYGKNSAYSAATDLYNSSNQGDLLGTIVCGTSTSLEVDGDYEYIGFRSASGAMYLTSVSIVWTTGGGSQTEKCATPSFNPASGTSFGNEGLNVTISTNTDDATIYYTLDGSNPTTSSEKYTSEINITTTTSIKAIAVKEGFDDSNIATATYTYVDPNAPGTENNPYTVAQAREAIDAGTGVTGVYATGVISQVDSYNSNYNSITYWISEDGTTTSDQLEVYSGKGLNNTNFTSVNDVVVGATVVVYGTLKKYGDVYEFDKNNYLTSYSAPAVAVEAPTFSPIAGTYADAQNVTISCETAGATIYYTTDGTEPTNQSTEYTGSIAVNADMTIKAIAYDVTGANSTVATATYHICSADNPYTVTQALAFSEYPANGVYVSGIVSTAPTQSPTNNGQLTYYISVNGEATNQLQVYKGLGLNEAAFTAQDDIQVGDEVTIYGNVKIYNNTKEFDTGNYLVAFNRPATPTITVTSTSLTGFTYLVDNGPSAAQQITIGGENLTNSWSAYLDDYGNSNFEFSFTEDGEYFSDSGVGSMPEPNQNVLIYVRLKSGLAAGDYTGAITITSQGAETVTVNLSGSVAAALEAPVWSELPTETISVGEDYVLNLADFVSGSPAPSITLETGGDIAQIQDNVFSFTPTEAGSFDFTFSASNSVGSANATLTVTVSAPASIEPSETAINIPAATTTGYKTIEVTYKNFTNQPTAHERFYDDDDNILTSNPATWIIVGTSDNNIFYQVKEENTSSEPRSVHFRIWAYDDNQQGVSSQLITITQAGVVAPVVDYAELPFNWDGGASSDLAALNGVTLSGNGSDYNTTHNPYLVKLDGDNDYILVKTDSRPDVVTVGVKMIGGGNTSTITVQESADGVTFSDVEVLTISGKQNDVLEFATTNAFAEDSRYVRLLFTKGSNVGVGPISISKPSNEPSITITPDSYEMDAKAGGGELPVVSANLATDPQLKVVFVEADGVTPATYDWISAEINNNGNIDGQITANTGDARTAYFYVQGVDADDNYVYSNLVTFTQEAAITEPYITVNTGSWDFDLNGGSKTFGFDFANLGDNPSFGLKFFESDGTTETQCGWIQYQFDPNDNKVTITASNNDENSARTAYFKIYAEVNKTAIYSNLVTINQAGPVVDYAELPFSFDGGISDIATTDGLTAEHLGSDYGSSPKLKFNNDKGTISTLVLKINEAPGTLTFDIKGNSFSGGTFKVQTSEDGTTYTDLKTYTELGDTQNESFNNLGENVRYIKWIYTEKSSGNVALGNITLAAYVAPSTDPSIDLGDTEINVSAASTDGVIIVGYNNITNIKAEVRFFEADGTTPANYDHNWVETEINQINNLVYVIDENTSSEARTAYLKIYALDDESNDVYSDLITINQEGYVEATTYSLATSITAGKHYLIVGSNSKTQEYYAMGLQNNNNRAAVQVSNNNGQISITDEDVAEVVVYGPDASGNYTIYDAETGYLYAANSSSNYLRSQFNNDLNGKWSIDIDGNGIASVEAKGDNSHNVMQFNSGSTIFSCYGSASQSSVSFYEKDNDDSEAYTANVTLNAFGYATFASNYALDFLDNEDANYSAWQIAEVNYNTNTITFEQITGMVAPATGILLKGKASNVVALNVLPAGGATLGYNKLVGITESTQVGDDQYFGLKGNEFVKVNTGVVPAGKALLPIDNPTAGVKSFTLIFNDADGIQTIETVSAEKAQAIFNLAGQRLPKAQKGINIINGKKVLVK